MYILLRNIILFDILVLTLWRQFFRSQPDAFLHYHESKQRESISNEFFSASLHLDFLSISKGIIIFVFCSEPFSNIVLRFLSQLFTAELKPDQWCPRIIYQWKTALEIFQIDWSEFYGPSQTLYYGMNNTVKWWTGLMFRIISWAQ